MTAAEINVRFAIRNGLARNGGARITVSTERQIVDDIMSVVFSPELRWAIEEYVKEEIKESRE